MTVKELCEYLSWDTMLSKANGTVLVEELDLENIPKNYENCKIHCIGWNPFKQKIEIMIYY